MKSLGSLVLAVGAAVVGCSSSDSTADPSCNCRISASGEGKNLSWGATPATVARTAPSP